MKSLIYKEWLVLKKNTTLIYLAVETFFAILLAFFASEIWFVWCACASVFAFALPTAFLNTDSTSGWGRFSEILPIKKSNIVSAKFAFGIVGWAWSSLVIGLFFVIGYFRHPEIIAIEKILSMLSVTSLGAIALAISFPFSFRFGASIGILVQVAVNSFVIGFFSGFGVVLEEYGTLEMMLTTFAVAVLFYFVSWLLSIRIYKKHGAK